MIADESIYFRLIRFLRSKNVIVESVLEDHRGVSDWQVFQLARESGKIVITEDSDFGEWVFAHGAQAAGVIFLRYSQSEREQIQTSLASILENPPKSLEAHFVTVTTRKIRMRSLP